MLTPKKSLTFGLIMAMVAFTHHFTWAEDQTTSVLTPPLRPYQDYLDPTLPKDISKIPGVPFEGERYEAEVPDTLDLAEHARETINYLTRLIAPKEQDYWVYHILYLNFNPAILEFGQAQWKNTFFAECIVLMRAMCGSNENLQQDRKLIGPLVWNTGIDGLTYQNTRFAGFQCPGTPYEHKPHADMLNQGRQLAAYLTWYEHTANALWKDLALKKIDRMYDLAVPQGDGFYFRMTRGYHPWYKEVEKGPILAMGDGEGVSGRMAGDAAGYTVQYTPQSAAGWYRFTNHEPAIKLAAGLARYLYNDPLFYDQKTGVHKIIKDGHTTVFGYCMTSLLSYALTVNDREIIKRVERGINQYLDWRDPDWTGIILAAEACQISDMVQSSLLLSRTGNGNYWEIVDRLMRNSISSMQIAQKDIDRFKSQPLCRAGDPDNETLFEALDVADPIPLNKPLPPGFAQPDDATERCKGAWFVTLDSRSASIGCCNGYVPLAVYLTWDSILENLDHTLKINLLMNRASAWADIDSFLPYEGKVVIKMKTNKDNVLVRIPEWTDWNSVTCKLHTLDPYGARRIKNRHFEWSERQRAYINIGKVKYKDHIVIEFALKEYVEHARIPVSFTGIRPTEVKQCNLTYRGNTLIDISDKEINYPMHMHEKYRAPKPNMHTVPRFICSQKSFQHWGPIEKWARTLID